MESLSLPEASKLYIALLKERFHGTKAATFHKFQHILVKYVAESTTVDTTRLFSEVNALFAERHDLIEIFRNFLDHNRDSSIDSNREDIIPDQKSIKIVMRSCVDFMNKVQRVLKDDEKFKSFMMIITGFQQHLDIQKVEREASFLFKEHPDLEIELAEFLAAPNARTSVQDVVVTKKRKRDRSKRRQRSAYEEQMFEYEDGLYKKNLGYNLILRAKEAAERLLKDDSGSKKLHEKICTADYFRGLNLEFMKIELKIKNKLLTKKWMKREKAIRRSKMLVSYLDQGIEILTRSWSEEKKVLIKMSREADLQIPVFDWHDDAR